MSSAKPISSAPAHKVCILYAPGAERAVVDATVKALNDRNVDCWGADRDGPAGAITGKLTKKIDKNRYFGTADRQEAGVAGLTSCSDGKFIYTWYADGIAVCHDLDGNRKWIKLENDGPMGKDGSNDDANGGGSGGRHAGGRRHEGS